MGNKYIYIDQSVRNGGAEFALRNIIDNQNRKENKSKILSIYPKPWFYEHNICLYDKCKIWSPDFWSIRIKGLSRLSRLIDYNNYLKKILYLNPEIVIFNGLYQSNISLVKKLKEKDIKIMYIIHALQWQQNLNKEILSFADVIIAVSECVKNELLLINNNINVHTRYIGVDRADWNVSDKVEKDTRHINILIPGAISKQKNQLSILKIVPIILQEFNNVKFTFVGGVDLSDGSASEFIKLFNDISKEYNKVYYLDFTNNINDYYLESDIVISLSNPGESFGRVLVEAGLFYNAVISSELGAVNEIIEHNESGLLINPSDENELISSIRCLIKDDNKRKKLSDRLNKTIKDKFDNKKCITSLLNLIESI